MVPKPGGPAIILGLFTASAIAYLYTSRLEYIAFGLVIIVTGIIGLVDDFKRLSGLTKPLILLPASLPILLLQVYEPRLSLPLVGTTRLTFIYPILVFLAITVTANTINTIDVLNGVVSAFITVTTVPLFIASVLKNSQIGVDLSLILLASSMALYIYHRYPSRIFPGDSGSLTLGAAYGATAIMAGVEMVGVVALLPAIFNSFLFLSSVKRLTEHSELNERPVVFKDGLLHASRNRAAPITLVRLILIKGSLTEKATARAIITLAIFSSLLAIVTAFLTWGFRF